MKKLLTMSGLLLGLAVLAPAIGAAEQESPEKNYVTQEELDGVRTEISTLSDQWKRSLDKSVVQSTRTVKFGGFAQGRYTQFEEAASTDGFEISVYALSLQGSLRKDNAEGRNLDYFISLGGNSSDFSVKPLEARLTYSLFQSIDKEKSFLTLTFGQQKKPFSLEALASEEFKPVIKSAQFATKLGLDPRDVGLVLSGDIFPALDYGFNYRVPLVQYSIGVVNGSGPNTKDENNSKDYVGRLVLNAPVDYNSPLRGLSLGASWYKGDKVASKTFGTGAAATTVKSNGDKNRWGADLAYVNTPIGFTVEYVRGSDAIVTGATAAAATVKVVESRGVTGTIFYNFGDQFVRAIKAQDRYDDWYPLTYQPFVRFDRWTPDLDVKGTHTDILTYGFNWFFAETTKLQINYNNKTVVTDGQPDLRDDELLAQFQFGF